MADLTPRAYLLRSYVNSGLTWWKALAEFIDNSINADCTRVVIDCSSRVLTITDDGFGAKDILSLFLLGDERHKRGNSIYGIGAKDAWLSCADEMEVSTVHRGVCSSLSVNIEQLINSNWQSPDPQIGKTDGASGTCIRLPLRKDKKLPNSEVFERLSWVFTPALRGGKQIIIKRGSNRELLKPLELPPRQDVCVSDFTIDGKWVHIDIGILHDGASIQNGPFWLIHKHRILEATSIGAGEYSVRRLAGTITLGEGWKISKNKDCLTESSDRIAEAILVRIEPILEKASQLSETLESELIRNEIQRLINSAVGEANKIGRGKRNKKPDGSIGSKAPSGRGGKHTRAGKVHLSGDVVQDSASTNKKLGGLQFDWETRVDKLDSIGRFEFSGKRVYLNDANPFVASIKQSDNRSAILCCVMSLIADDQCKRDQAGHNLFKFAYSDFSEAVGKLLSERESKEGLASVAS